MGASSPLILDVDAEVAGHIAVALRAYMMKSRRDYRAVPPELDAIGDVMAHRAMRRQQATPLEDLWRVQQAEHVAPRLMTIPQAAQMLQCSVRTLQRRIAGGSLPAVHNGGLTRIRVEDLDNYLIDAWAEQIGRTWRQAGELAPSHRPHWPDTRCANSRVERSSPTSIDGVL